MEELMADEKPKIVNVDNSYVPDIFTDGYSGVMVSDGTVRLNLTTLQIPLPVGDGSVVPAQKKIVARLIIPVSAFVKISAALAKNVTEGQKDEIYPLFDAETGEFKSPVKKDG